MLKKVNHLYLIYMKITDRPGRYYAIFFFSPSLFISSFIIHNCNFFISLLLFIHSISLFSYEIYWITYKNDETVI